MLNKTPDELGYYRKKNINGYNFLVSYIINEAKEREKAMKKAKAGRKGRR